MKNTTREHSIYLLIDPRDELPFYVGITNDPEIRFTQHMDDDINLEKHRRIQSIHADGLEPGMIIIEKWDERRVAKERERYWVLTYIDWGVPLTNIVYAEHFMLKERVPEPEPEPERPFCQYLDVRTAGWSHYFYDLKPVGWLQYFEINDAWDAFLRKRRTIDRMASGEDIDQFIASFIPPVRIAILRERDRDRLRVWRKRKQWRVSNPEKLYPVGAILA